MAQTGILDYQRYLNTLQTLNNLGQTFPTNQQTYNFSITGSTTASWTATVSWETLILDKVSYSSKASGYVPNVDNSQVIGYFEGSTTTQYSTGVISIPANMYTGPILPGGDFNVPLTVVHLSWFDGTTRYAQQIGFIQNWEPGVEIGDPTLDFNFFPVYSIPSTLTLTGEAGIVYGDNLTLVATTDMSIDLGVNATRVRFYRESTGTNIVLGTAYFTGTVATLVVPTNPDLPIGNYNIYAVSQPRGVYRSATSNTLNVRVEAGVPLIVTTSTFTPSQAYYYPGHTVNYRLGVIADPAFTATGVAIANPIDIKLVDAFTPFTETNILSGNFVNGQTTTNFTVQSSMIDVARQYPQTTWSITTSTQNSTQYTATIFVSNTETVASSWGYQTLGRYRNGSTSTTINVATSTSVTVTGQAFPLTITQSSTSTYYDESFSLTVGTNTATYYTNISIVAVKGSTSTTLYSGNNSGTSSFTVNNLTISTTGTWSIYATYPGDLGSSLINANLPSTSNTLTHIVRLGNDLIPTPVVTTERTATADIIRISATTSTTLTNTLTYFAGVASLGTSSWVRYNTYSATTVTTVEYAGLNTISGYLNGGMIRNWDYTYDKYRNGYSAYGWSAASGPYQNWPTTGEPTRTWWIPQKVNGSRLFKYYDGSNYNLSAVTGTNYDELLDPISFGTTWYTNFVSTVTTNGQGMRDATGLTNILGPYAAALDARYLPVTINVYDIYRIDLVGDTRGYNVIGLDSSVFTGTTDVSTSSSRRLYFKTSPYKSPVTGIRYSGPTSDNPVKTRYIDLIKYIGETTWTRPDGRPITVKLFQFSPTIPQTNREYKTNANGGIEELNLPIPVTTTTYQAWDFDLGYYTVTIPADSLIIKEFSTSRNNSKNEGQGYLISTNPPVAAPRPYQLGGYGAGASSGEYDRWRYYGVKYWASTNPGNATADNLAEFYNEWYSVFGVGQNPGASMPQYRQNQVNVGSVWFEPIITTSTTYTATPTNLQTGTLVLARDTLPTSSDVHVRWPGTTALPIEYGRYNSFDIYAEQGFISDSPKAVNASVISYNTGSTATVSLEYQTGKIYQPNPVKIKSSLIPKQFDGTTTLNTGSVEFYNVGTGQVISTGTITNNVASISVYSTTLTTASGNTEFTINSRIVGQPVSIVPNLIVTATNYTGFTFKNINYDVQTGWNISNAGPSNIPKAWKKPGISYFDLVTLTNPGIYKSGTTCLTGEISIIAPYFVKGADNFYSTGTFYPIYANYSSLYITVSTSVLQTGGNSSAGGAGSNGYWDQLIDANNSSIQGRYKIEQPSIQYEPNIVTLQFNNSPVYLRRATNPAPYNFNFACYWSERLPGQFVWGTITVRLSIEAYDDNNNLVATIPASCLLGHYHSLRISRV